MKKLFILLSILTSTISTTAFAAQSFEEIGGNRCVVLEVSTMNILSEAREVLTQETSTPVYLGTSVLFFTDDLYTKGGTTYSTFVAGDQFNIKATKNNKVISLSTATHKGLLSFMDLENSVHILCNSELSL